ncbi:MAG: 2-enoyl thioester reductase domain-containing protein [Chthoniobacterales bacterium]|nr:2-enoyl thioester reductase domain-containing protein [Chthoniobacterales bacterium]
METGTVVRAARYHATGIPADVLQVDEITLPPPAPGQVRVRMLAAPINPADLNMLEGKYGESRPLPDVPGNEGVGRVLATGDGVPSDWLGQQVLVDSEAWREQGNWDVSGLVRVPDTIAPRDAAFLRVNPPTAWRLLHDFVPLQPGDWIVQNLAGSSVGRAVIEIARRRGWKTLNVVRRPEAAEELRALGADAVLVDGPSLAEEFGAVLGGVKPKLALNAVGGAAATRLAGLLATGGTMVTYGAMSKEALKIPNGFLIFRDISFRGFWLTRWLRGAGEEVRKEMFDGIFTLAEEGLFRPPVTAEFPLGQVSKAVAAASEGARGKILLHLGD